MIELTDDHKAATLADHSQQLGGLLLPLESDYQNIVSHIQFCQEKLAKINTLSEGKIFTKASTFANFFLSIHRIWCNRKNW